MTDHIEYTKQLLAELMFSIETDKSVKDLLLFASDKQDNNEENKLHSPVQ
jgi:hypothetical protein